MTIKLAEPKFDTITVRDEPFVMQVNPPLSLLADLQSDDGDRTIAALDRIIQSHPVVGDDGKPAAIEDFDSELVGDITQAWSEHLRNLPKASASPSATHGRGRRR